MLIGYHAAVQGFAGELDLGDVLNQHRPVRKPGERILAGQRAPSKKQQAKDAKFGERRLFRLKALLSE